MADALQAPPSPPATGAPLAESTTHDVSRQPRIASLQPRISSLQPGNGSPRPRSDVHLEEGSTSSVWSSAPSAPAGSWGRSPFAPTNKQAATTCLAQCYEQMMADPVSQQPAQSSSTQLPHAYSPGPRPLQHVLTAGSINEPHEYVFIFTNPRSGNRQGRSLMDMALHSFRLRDRPDVQVQIYDITDKTSLGEGLHYIRQLQMHQGDRLMKSAFPELFDGRQSIRPSPGVRSTRRVPLKVRPPVVAAAAAAAASAAVAAVAANAAATASPDDNDAEDSSPQDTPNTCSVAWDEWISDVSTMLQSGLSRYSEEEATQRLEAAQGSIIKLHVWSAGGDGTVSSTLEAMMAYGIDVERVYFSSIPFGTGNDFADALGWGRSVPGDGVGGSMRLLNKIISERLEGYTCKLDIYEVTITTYDGGHIKHVERDMHSKPGMTRYTCLMIDYLSIGVQGFVGSSFEMHRPGSRSLNILMYTAAAAKWVFLRRFPPINEALESISTVPDSMLADTRLSDADRAKWLETASEEERKQVLLARVAGPHKRSHGRKMKWTKEPKARRTATAQDFGAEPDLPVIQCKPIEIDIQNVARFWGRDIDVWDSAHDHGRLLSSREGVTDSSSWTPQYAGDGKLELFAVRDIGDYALNQLPGRDTYRIGRLAQMGSPVAMHFRTPETYPPRSRKPLSSRRGIEPGLLYAMCDGEFIEMYRPRDVIVTRKVTLKAVGRSPATSRIVRDTIRNDGIDAVQMEATAAANKTCTGQPVDVSSYVASPFQRFFGLSRRNNAPATTSSTSSTSANGSQESRTSDPSTSRRPTLRSIRDSFRRSIHGSAKDSSTSSSNDLPPPPPPLPTLETLNQPPSIVQSQSARSQGLRSGALPESPLRQRQSLSGMRLPSRSSETVGDSGLSLPPSANQSVARTHSKSLDFGQGRAGHSSASPDGPTPVANHATSASTSASSSSSSGVSEDNSEAELSSSNEKPPPSTNVMRQRPGCLDTTGKDLVNFVEQPATPQSASPRAPSWDN
ncbi:hypothetical protein LPJ61_001840 [Coemansia biformis]|uniref:DAGKc domain-containing protein n=1 Tax=Coemansia biformis TaxID=1286918 RepID=A0A9W8CXQ9_9FUNG|nr:hypothetical protein LPJ61_001840 [Coemansia biformis]